MRPWASSLYKAIREWLICWARWKLPQPSRSSAEKSARCCGSAAAWRAQSIDSGAAAGAQHWRPVGERCRQRCGARMHFVVLAFMVVPFWDGRGTPTRVFLEKRLQDIENNGNGRQEARKEALSYWKHRSNRMDECREDGRFGAGVDNSRPRLA